MDGECEGKEVLKSPKTILFMDKNLQNFMNYESLIRSKGKQLEISVRDAFYALGFLEIREGRARNLEDYIIDFRTGVPPFLGIIEVKGSNKRTSLSDLAQCNKWAEDYFIEHNIPSKGIFVSNQYILEPYPENKDNRVHFEPNELDYAKTRDICIIPACELFEAVLELLKGNTRINRDYIENIIYATNGAQLHNPVMVKVISSQ